VSASAQSVGRGRRIHGGIVFWRRLIQSSTARRSSFSNPALPQIVDGRAVVTPRTVPVNAAT